MNFSFEEREEESLRFTFTLRCVYMSGSRTGFENTSTSTSVVTVSLSRGNQNSIP